MERSVRIWPRAISVIKHFYPSICTEKEISNTHLVTDHKVSSLGIDLQSSLHTAITPALVVSAEMRYVNSLKGYCLEFPSVRRGLNNWHKRTSLHSCDQTTLSALLAYRRLATLKISWMIKQVKAFLKELYVFSICLEVCLASSIVTNLFVMGVGATHSFTIKQFCKPFKHLGICGKLFQMVKISLTLRCKKGIFKEPLRWKWCF